MNALPLFSTRSAVRCSGRPTAAACAASWLTIFSRARSFSNGSTGCPRGQAIERAISAMGDAHSLGLLLRRTRFPLRGLFLTLMTSLIWAAIAACILYLLLHLGLRT